MDINKLIKEYKTLDNSLEMYNNTLEEMSLKGAKQTTIDSIKEEMDNINNRKQLLEKAFELIENGDVRAFNDCVEEFYEESPKMLPSDREMGFTDTLQRNESRIPIKHRAKKNKYEMPLDAVPIKTNQFLVHFPDKYGIEPYMIEAYSEYETNVLSVVIREFEGKYPILPVTLMNMEEDTFTITIDTLSSGNKVYYSTIYEGCKLVKEEIGKPYNTYVNSQTRTYNIIFSVENISYLTCNETAN